MATLPTTAAAFVEKAFTSATRAAQRECRWGTAKPIRGRLEWLALDVDFAFHPALGMSGYGALVFDLALGERHRDFLSAVTAYFGFCRADL